MNIDIGFGRVLRVRLLQASPTRRHIFRPKVETLSALKVRAAKAQDLIERRRLAWLEGTDNLDAIEKEIRRLGYEFQDEESADDGRVSYWRLK